MSDVLAHGRTRRPATDRPGAAGGIAARLVCWMAMLLLAVSAFGLWSSGVLLSRSSSSSLSSAPQHLAGLGSPDNGRLTFVAEPRHPAKARACDPPHLLGGDPGPRFCARRGNAAHGLLPSPFHDLTAAYWPFRSRAPPAAFA